MYSDNHSIPLLQGCLVSNIIKTRYDGHIQLYQMFPVSFPNTHPIQIISKFYDDMIILDKIMRRPPNKSFLNYVLKER